MFLTLLQSGGAGPGVITGTLSAVESGADTLSAEGVVRIAGELAATETGADTFAATGTATNAITGSLAAVETGADTLSATGVVEGGSTEVSDSPHGRIRRGRHAADFQPDWLLEALNPPKPPRRARKRREEDLVMLA
jgi:hypothetical protein